MRNLFPIRIPFKITRMASTQPPKLPRLPVPVLHKTLERYAKSAKPFLCPDEIRVTEDILKKFGQPGGVGELLQEKLKSRAEKCNNWLEEWWINSAYLEYRDPVVIFSSPGLVFPSRKFESLKDQLETAAKLTTAALNYKKKIDDGDIPAEMFGKFPLDMGQYKKVFGTVRQPFIPRDNVVFHCKSEHIIVIYKNNFFKVPVKSDAGYIKPSEMFKLLERIVKDCQEGPGIGLLTSEHRDTWAKAYAELKKDSKNCSSIQDIEESIFVLCIDSHLAESRRTELETTSANLIHGDGLNSANRWFDKTIQFVVGKNYGWGLTYEHCPAEGQAIARMMDYIVEVIDCEPINEASRSSCIPEPVKLKFELSQYVECAIDNASANLCKLSKNLDINCIKFTSFGKDAIKKLKVSPDSFIQMAMQYAFYRIHKTPGAQYETGSTRMFAGGRTETIRSCSEESVRFAQAMLDNKLQSVSKARALLLAINAHKEYTLMAMTGQGVDRHMLGFRKIAAEEGISQGLEIFNDEAWKRSTNMRVSTSQVAAKCDGFMIYGPLVNDGYACCYNPQDNAIIFGTTSWHSCDDTDLKLFGEALQDSLCEMRSLLENNPSAKL